MEKIKLNALDSTVKSSYRTLAIFEFFAETQRPATVSEICQSLQIPQSSTSTLLKSLVETSFLSFDKSTRTFEPTLRMAFLTHWTQRKSPQAAHLPDIIKGLCRDIGETTVLAVRNGIYSQYIYVENVGNTLGHHVETGSVRPLISSATGWSLLKDESDAEIGKIIRRSTHEITNHEWLITPADVMERIKHAREKGYALSKGEITKTAAGIAISLEGSGSFSRMSIAVTGPKNRILDRQSELIGILDAARAQINPSPQPALMGRA